MTLTELVIPFTFISEFDINDDISNTYPDLPRSPTDDEHFKFVRKRFNFLINIDNMKKGFRAYKYNILEFS